MNRGIKHLCDHVHCRWTPRVTAYWRHHTTNREKVYFWI